METQITRFSELHIGRNKVIKNRVVVPPMASETATQDGFATPKTFHHYENLAQAGAGLLTVEYTFVHQTGRSEENQLGISTDAHIEGHSKITQLIHSAGSLAGIQLSHGGGKSERTLTGGVLMGPSAIAVPVKGRETEIADPMNHEEIRLWKHSFIAASDRAVTAGYDLIELHSAHGYGLNQWLSPITNQRSDEYGCDLNGRTRLLLEIVREIRIRHPRVLISVRMPGQDFFDGGISNADSIHIAKSLEEAGVDIINVSSGIGGWKRPEARVGEGYLVSDAAKIQAKIKIPVIGVGGIETGCFIDRALSQERFSLAAVGRAILKSPKIWGQNNLSTDKEKICPQLKSHSY